MPCLGYSRKGVTDDAMENPLVFIVEVDVATCRPPKVDATATVRVEAYEPVEAHLVACQMLACHPHVVMPVGSRTIGVEV